MTRLFSVAMVASQLSLISAIAIADPVYVGERFSNPESETFGDVVTPALPTPILFVGPAAGVGEVTGDPEKDTVAFQAINVDQTQPAFGSEGARELQGYLPVIVVLIQPADGARAAREVQAPPNSAPTQLAEQAR